MRGIEPPLRAWEARVLPLNYIRGQEKRDYQRALSTELASPVRLVAGEHRCHAPRRHQDPDGYKKYDASLAELALHPPRVLSLAVLAPRQQIADQQSQAESGHQFCEEGIDSENVDHG